MSVEVISSTLSGFEASKVKVECSLLNSLPAIAIVGLGNKAVDEAKERVRSAITSSGLQIPRKKIIVNLAPADVAKQGSSLDLAIAVAILLASKQIPASSTDNCVFVGELALDGQIRGIRGVLGHIHRAKQAGEKIFVPQENLEQAQLVGDGQIIAVSSIKQLYKHLCSEIKIEPVKPITVTECGSRHAITLSDIRGQELAKRALMVAVAGRHNLLLSGPPGTGKTMLSRAATSVMPPLNREEIYTLTHLYSISRDSQAVISCRPFRSPHHTTSQIALIGGGRIPQPGEVSLAHCGILFLDELLEFPRNALEALRQPMEDRLINVVRTEGNATFPADFMLIATLNPCPCGYLGDSRRQCTCTSQLVYQYQKKLSGPLQDRFDLHINVPRASLEDADQSTASSDQPKQEVKSAWSAQMKRNNNVYNSELSLKQLEKDVLKDSELKSYYRGVSDKLDLSTRGYVRTLRVARTIADLESSADVTKQHLLEALSYRQKLFS